MHTLPQILVERRALAQPRFLIRGESILASEPDGRMILMLVVRVVGGLTIFVIKLRMSLGRSGAGAHDEQCRHANGCQPVRFQETPPWVMSLTESESL